MLKCLYNPLWWGPWLGHWWGHWFWGFRFPGGASKLIPEPQVSDFFGRPSARSCEASRVRAVYVLPFPIWVRVVMIILDLFVPRIVVHFWPRLQARP